MCLLVVFPAHVAVAAAVDDDYQSAWSASSQSVSTRTPGSAANSTLRHRFAVALQAAARLATLGAIDAATRGRLKELILSQDEDVMAAVETFDYDGDADQLLDTMLRISARA